MKKMLLGLLLLAGAPQLFAQEDMHKDFEDFRRRLHSDYEGFRRKVLDDYADFLDGVWRDYEVFRGAERNPLPKPRRRPVAEHPGLPAQPVRQQPVPVAPPAVTPAPVATDPVRPAPVSPPASEVPRPVASQPVRRVVTFGFYGLRLTLPEMPVGDVARIGTDGFATAWRRLKKDDAADDVIEGLRRTGAAMGLNDWLTVELVRAYADGLLRDATPSARIVLAHYLLVHLGYDFRLARTGRQPLLLMHCRQQIYARTFIRSGETKLYIWTDNLSPVDEGDRMSIQTCDLPKDADTGAPVDLRFVRPLNLPDNPKTFSVSHGGMTLGGTVNATAMEMVRRYPQMPVPDYAASCLDARLRESLVRQVREQLEGLAQLEAVNKLLRFIQFGFEYATDDELHGYEKPYFVEELFYYPKCDCEDRSVLFATLLRQALGVENVLVHYPGHECVAVSLDRPVGGDGFTFEGRDYYISDPTYIGAVTGQCMPDYRRTSPEVQKW